MRTTYRANFASRTWAAKDLDALLARIKELETELRWAWDNLRHEIPPAVEESEYDFCVVCGMPDWKHAPNCAAIAHKANTVALLQKEG